MNDRKRVVYVVSDIEKALAFEWLAAHLKSRCELSFILVGAAGTELEKYLTKTGVTCFVVNDGEYPGHFVKLYRVFGLIRKLKPDIIHTHLWRANVFGLFSGWLIGVKKRIFTRHHAMVHYHEHPSGRKWDKFCNFIATDIIAISNNVKEILIEHDGASPAKIRLLHHGFDLAYFKDVDQSRISRLRVKHQIPAHAAPIIGVIARYVEWKGIQFVIPAFQGVLKRYPDAHLVLANAAGPYKSKISELLGSLPPKSYTEITFEADLAGLYRLFDVYVHVPVDKRAEAFGQTYVESLLCKVPAVFTHSGIAPEFIIDGVHARVVPFQDPQAIEMGIIGLLEDKNLRERLSHDGYSAATSFSIHSHVDNLLRIYQ